MNLTLKDCKDMKSVIRRQILAIERAGTQRKNIDAYKRMLESEERLDRQIKMLEGGFNHDRANFRTF